MSTIPQHNSLSARARVGMLQKKMAGLMSLPEQDAPRISTGCESLDRLLPGRGMQVGMIVEWLADGLGSGAGSLAMQMAKRAVQELQGSLVVTDRWRRFYPPGAMLQGIDLTNLIVVRSDAKQIMSTQEELWALDQALRCPGVSAVVAWVERIDPRAFRRLQLAAEAGKTLMLLIRPGTVRSQPTWSDVQLLVSPRSGEGQQENRFCRVTLLRQRGRTGTGALEGASVELEIDEQQGPLECVRRHYESHSLHLASRLAHSTTRRRSARA